MPGRYELKRLTKDAGDDDVDSLDDARALAAIDDPHVSSAMQIPAARASQPSLLVIERPTGDTLDTKGTMSADRAVHVAIQIAHALAAAHASGVMHRNVRPKNVLLVRTAFDDEFVKLAGFGGGVRKKRDRFVPPEGNAKKVAGVHTDVFGVGACLDAMLGRTAKRDRALDRIIARATSVDPKARFATAAELESALREWTTGGRTGRPDGAWIVLGGLCALGVALIAFNDHHEAVALPMAMAARASLPGPSEIEAVVADGGPMDEIGPPHPASIEGPPAPPPIVPVVAAVGGGEQGTPARAAVAPSWQPPRGSFYVEEPLRYVLPNDGEAWRVATSKKVMRCVETIGSGDCALENMELHCAMDRHGVVNCSRLTPHERSGRVCEVPPALDDCIERAAGGLVGRPKFDRADVHLAEMKYWLRRVR